MGETSIVEIVVSVLVLLGAVFALIGSIGLAKLPDTLTRLHGPTKATTLGVGGVLLGSVLYFSSESGVTTVHELLIIVFLFLTAPISAHLIAKAALHRRLTSRAPLPAEWPRRRPDAR
jgi:multicomponent K+:H+ antiporter subunit G